MIPFNPDTKMMIVAYRVDEVNASGESTVRIIVKGSPESVLDNCVDILDENF